MTLFFDIVAKAFHIEPLRREQRIRLEHQRTQVRRQQRQDANAACCAL
jgi:hypothetical protein